MLQNNVLEEPTKKANEPRHDKTNKVSVRPASAQSDQCLRCPHEETLDP